MEGNDVATNISTTNKTPKREPYSYKEKQFVFL